MKLVSINTTPTVLNVDGTIRRDVTDLNRILDNIDSAGDRSGAIRGYIYALRDLQRANDEYAFDGSDGAAIDHAELAVRAAFARLIEIETAMAGS